MMMRMVEAVGAVGVTPVIMAPVIMAPMTMAGVIMAGMIARMSAVRVRGSMVMRHGGAIPDPARNANAGAAML